MKIEKIEMRGDLIGAEGVETLREAIQSQWTSGTEILRIDMSGVTLVDYDIMVEFLSAQNQFRQAGRQILLDDIPRRVRKIIEMFRIPVGV